jgi:glycosyltransferase involved in cell wall biosynthesis
MGEIKENIIGQTGISYQAYIRNGYSVGKNFISVSQKTKNDLIRILPGAPKVSEVIYNGLNRPFSPKDKAISRKILGNIIKRNLSDGYILHVGGNDWYKNRIGVIEIYNAWRNLGSDKIPLLLVGSLPDKKISDRYNQSLYKSDIYFSHDLDDESVCLAYSGAHVLLFPSLDEGFGWPIAEAMASGCPVITTGEAPMTEVGGKAAYYIPKRPIDNGLVNEWAMEGAQMLSKVLNLPLLELKKVIESSLENSKRFELNLYLDQVEKIYSRILLSESSKPI